MTTRDASLIFFCATKDARFLLFGRRYHAARAARMMARCDASSTDIAQDDAHSAFQKAHTMPPPLRKMPCYYLSAAARLQVHGAACRHASCHVPHDDIARQRGDGMLFTFSGTTRVTRCLMPSHMMRSSAEEIEPQAFSRAEIRADGPMPIRLILRHHAAITAWSPIATSAIRIGA